MVFFLKMELLLDFKHLAIKLMTKEEKLKYLKTTYNTIVKDPTTLLKKGMKVKTTISKIERCETCKQTLEYKTETITGVIEGIYDGRMVIVIDDKLKEKHIVDAFQIEIL